MPSASFTLGFTHMVGIRITILQMNKLKIKGYNLAKVAQQVRGRAGIWSCGLHSFHFVSQAAKGSFYKMILQATG